ncbi:hypothetical protein KKC44_01100 [Patescibacteria group bacterium]|nr:hypothetical protein [Patescibacteria group bacterium]MBU2259180.1 hypothetical protein [Patescibacteria group bacterium]
MKHLHELYQNEKQRITMALSREESSIKTNEQARKDEGWFGGLKRVLTTSDPYKIEISNSSQKINTLKYTQDTLGKDIDNIFNKDPNEITREDFDKAVDLIGRVRNVVSSINKADTSTDHWEANDQAITAVRDLSIGLATAPLAFVGAGPASGGLAAAARYGTYTAVKVAAADTITRNYDDVRSGQKTVGEAVTDGTIDVSVAAAFGALAGTGANILSKARIPLPPSITNRFKPLWSGYKPGNVNMWNKIRPQDLRVLQAHLVAQRGKDMLTPAGVVVLEQVSTELSRRATEGENDADTDAGGLT